MSREVATYRDADIELEIQLDGREETLWLTQEQIAELFGVNVPAISKHIKNIYAEDELTIEATLSKMETVRNEGGRTVVREIAYYNLDMVLSVGYRVSSKRATRFRQWATAVLRSYITKGYALNPCNQEILKRLAEIEKRLSGHDHQLEVVFNTLRQMLTAPGSKGRQIGFRVED